MMSRFSYFLRWEINMNITCETIEEFTKITKLLEKLPKETLDYNNKINYSFIKEIIND